MNSNIKVLFIIVVVQEVQLKNISLLQVLVKTL
jgi:hypothetical protein